MNNRITLIVLLLFFSSSPHAQIIIPNDSLTIKKELFKQWGIENEYTTSIVFINGISNNYKFPRMINKKLRQSIKFFDPADSVVCLKDGIYYAALPSAHYSRLFLFCRQEKIEIFEDHEIYKLLEYFLHFCKERKYAENEMIRELKVILKRIENSYYLTSDSE